LLLVMNNIGRRAVLQKARRAQVARQQAKAHNDELVVQMKEQMAAFEAELQKFAVEQRENIQRDPVLRAKFHEMCQRLGVDPLTSRKGIWAKLLGIGDFYYELGVRVIEVCVATRHINGGILALSELLRKLRARANPAIRGSIASADDVERAVKKLEVLGSGLRIVDIGQKEKLVRSVPIELSPDHTRVLNLCTDRGYITHSGVKRALSWEDARIDATFNFLLHTEMAWIDEQCAEGRAYWILGLVGGSAD
jgi:ESCRT-II complex subunit VPS22